MKAAVDAGALAAQVRQGDRRALARAITLVESTRPDQQEAAGALMSALGPAPDASLRIGLTGTPGVGKSTFIETFGTMLTGLGHRVAVLAVDPSSARSGGSILGDKTRMERLARDPRAFIRPSPSGAEAGGVARRTRETIRLCEAAGFDIVLVETVGVGQSETMVAHMTDIFLLLIAPAGGDDLQGVKRGILEHADLVVVTKADGDLTAVAMRTLGDYAGALRLFRRRPGDPDWVPATQAVSSVTGEGVPGVWDAVCRLAAFRRGNGSWRARRAAQDRQWFEEDVRRGVLDAIAGDARVAERIATLGPLVEAGQMPPSQAAAEVLAAFRKRQPDH
jgi:LAO/AO transport system kinase